MDRARDQFFSRPTLSSDQNRRACWGNLTDHRKDMHHLRRRSDQVTQGPPVAQLLPQLAVFLGQPAVSTRPLDQHAEGRNVDGLFQEPESAQIMNRGNSHFQAAKGGQYNRGGQPVLRAELPDQLEAIHPGHLEISKDHSGSKALQHRQRIKSVFSRAHFVPPSAQGLGKALTFVLVVINHEKSHRRISKPILARVHATGKGISLNFCAPRAWAGQPKKQSGAGVPGGQRRLLEWNPSMGYRGVVWEE